MTNKKQENQQMRYFILFITMTFTTLGVFADSFTVSGIVTSSTTRKPVADAEIRVMGTNISVITNEEGLFTLRLEQEPQRLKVIALGYRNVEVDCGKVTDLLNVRIGMQPQSYVLNPVTVYSADNIVMAALAKVEDNYADEAECLKCFYRETIRKQSRYIGLTEAVMNLHKTPYSNDVRNDKVQVIKGRSLISQRLRDTLSVKVMGGPHDAVVLDMVKNRELLFYPDDLPMYQFTMKDNTTIDDRMQYVISFHPTGVKDYPLYYGTLYVDCETLAFTRIEASLDMSDKAKATAYMLIKKPRGLRFKPKALDMTVAYHYDGEKSRMHYVRTSYYFQCDWRRRLFATSYRATSEMVVTDYAQSPVPKGRKNMFGQYDILSSEVADFTDDAFWDSYNILEPSESLENAVVKLRKRAGGVK